MDDPTDDSWTPNGAQLSYQRVSYHNGGYLVTGRTSTWRGIKQDFKTEKVKTMIGRTYKTAMYVKPGPAASVHANGVEFFLQLRSTDSDENQRQGMNYATTLSSVSTARSKEPCGHTNPVQVT